MAEGVFSAISTAAAVLSSFLQRSRQSSVEDTAIHRKHMDRILILFVFVIYHRLICRISNARSF
jgi:hypothetical protein